MIKRFPLILCGAGFPWISFGAAPEKPNVVIICGDDVGYGNRGANGVIL